MMMRFFLFIILGSLPGLLVAQADSADRAFLARAMQHQREKYSEFVQANSSLYNASEYKEIVVNSHDIGMPYYLSDDWIEGTIIYNGRFHGPVDLMYDAVNNKIITHPYNSYVKIELVYEKVARFTLENRIFIKLKESSGTDNFYEQLVDGPVGLYALRKKALSRQVGSGKVTQFFIDKTAYYVLVNEKFMLVRNRSDLFKVFPNDKSRIKKRLAEKKITFRRNFEDALIESVSVHNSQL